MYFKKDKSKHKTDLLICKKAIAVSFSNHNLIEYF